MKTIFKRFDYFLNLFLVSTVIAIGVIIYLDSSNSTTHWSQFVAKEGSVISILLLISFLFGLFYLIIGILLLVITRRKKNIEKNKLAKSLIFKGFFRSITAFVIFFIFSLALSFFGLSLDQNCMCLPKIIDPNKPGFPVEDLKVTKRKLVPPQMSDDSWYCDVTVQNNNSKMTAINLSFNHNQYEESSEDDSIPPGQVNVITIYSDNINENNPCKNVSITSAEIMVPVNN